MAVTFLQKSSGNSATTTLSSAVTNTDTSFPLTSDTAFLSGGGLVIIDEGQAAEELAYYTGKSGGALTIPLANRGLEGGSAQGHDSGASVKGVLSADMWNNLIETVLNGFSATDGSLDTSKVLPSSYLDTDGTLAANSDSKIATQKATKTYTDNRTTTFGIQVFDAGSDTSTGDAKAYFTVPSQLNGFNLTAVKATAYTAGTTGTTDIQIRNKTQTADMLSTKITIDSTETDSATAATAAVIDTGNDDVATGDVIAIDVDAVSTTVAKGLFVLLTFTKP